MQQKILLPVLAGVGLLLGVVAIYFSLRKPSTPPIEFPPPKPPYEHFIAAAGMVEASSSNIMVGTEFSEIVEEVYVNDGDYVEKDAPLFRMNTSLVERRLDKARASLEVALAKYQKQIALPRSEEVPPREAIVQQAKARHEESEKRYEIVKKIENPKAVSRDEVFQRQYETLITKYELKEAQKNLELLLAGAWIRDLEIARAQVNEAKADIAIFQAELDRHTVRAPFDGVAMQVNIHVGELAVSRLEGIGPLILFGTVHPLNIKVQVDEEDVWRVVCGAPGCAFVRGNSKLSVPLDFVNINPFLIAKTSLTGDNTERVDTRVLEITYCFERGELPIYPGQIMDVYLKAKPNVEPP